VLDVELVGDGCLIRSRSNLSFLKKEDLRETNGPTLFPYRILILTYSIYIAKNINAT
jgi:hypothetical protein